MNIYLTDLHCRDLFFPFTHTRSVADIRCGILTIREKWNLITQSNAHSHTVDYLLEYEGGRAAYGAQNHVINAQVFPHQFLWHEISALANGSVLMSNDKFIAACLSEEQMNSFDASQLDQYQKINSQYEIFSIDKVTDIFSKNDRAIQLDFDLLSEIKTRQSISKTNTLINEENIFIEEGAIVEASILNASAGPIYVAKGAEIMEGCMVRGPFALCEGAQLKMGAKIYGATTLGPGCKVGGEVNNSVFFANSSKAHDGFIGNSVIGEWCNFGADSNNSNLKNNYEEVKLWNEKTERFEKTGLQFCGLLFGDHSKCGINTMFNTGTVVGVSCNIFGSGFPRNFVPSFSWGGASGFTEYQLEKALQTMKLVFARRSKELTEKDRTLYQHIYNHTQYQRKYS